ncbi:MAG: amino acid adenylation domain-containing protein, partial [Candidatus Aminicenantes bacterium]|nr:amino acid adenylation domain-containing protein [Candidatus Aminicenantes bacterium]NIM79301.1 amino acid adenylation domain-containing protein [Candidatus Aminicenantes bacterium]NIN23048.1 amino acid adenylation domain-containing protein [Candidatus Aminicenantes bacterium]NIN46775.1 amino acid adenylation domain-containing protein [Candidatus Aminicenantes bacterium]NIN89697.1 amino acid adenylation domain-containing protein [Candidatus Aminicenantes bacterium]
MMDLNHRISKLSPEQRKIFKLKLEQEGIDISRISSPGISESQLSQGTSPHPPGREKSIYHPIEPTEEKEYYPLSAAQKRMYILNLFVEYNLRLVFQVDGNLDRNRFRQVFRQLVKRHESFRTSFQLMAGEPVQKIHDHVVVDMEYHDLSTQAQEVNSIISRFFRGVDLSVPPLLRVGLIRLSAARYIYLVNIHHIIADGTSIGLLAREFVPLYQGKELSALKIRYKDYSQWQNRLFNTGEYKKKEAYWLELFSGELPVLNMPTDYPRPPMQSFEGRRVCFSIAGETFRSLKSLAAKQKVSIYMLLMAVYNALLFRYTGQEDIVIGTIAAGRQQRELESLFGVFINALTIRNYPEKSKTFKGFLGEIKQNTLDAYENQLYPFGDLLDQVVKNKDLSRNPLFDVMFIFQNVDMRTRWEMKDLGFVLSRYEYSSSHYAQQDITLWAAMEGDQIRMDLDYCKVLFKPETMECFTRHFLTFLTGAVANPDLELAGIEMINPEERHRLLVEFNNTSIPFPEGKSIRELFADQVEKKPHHISLISSEPWEVSLTYRELDRRADQLACLLRKKGTQADTIVGIMMERSIEMVIGVTAVLKAGGAYLPLDTAYPGERIRYMLSDSGSRLLLTTRQVLTESEKIGKWEGETVFMEADAGNTGAAASFPPPTPWRENSLVYVIYTSGSTGKPKGVMVQQGNFVNATFGWRKEYKLRYMEVNLLQIASFSFDVFAGDFARALFNGGKLVICPEETRVDPPSLYSLIRKQRITLFESTPSLVIPFMEYVYENRLAIDNLKLLIIGSDICRTADFKRLISRFGSQMRIINSYGVTEAAVDSSYYEETLEHIPPVGSVPIGKPMPNMTFFVLDYGKKLQPIGIPGELCIGGAGVTRGYLSNPELTNKKFLRGGPGGAVFSKSAPPGRRRQKLYKTGDLARWLADGNVEILGRIDHQVKIRGFRIELVELESQLLKYPGIKEAVVTARKNNVENISLCAYYVANREGTFEIPTNDRLREYLFQSLPDYMIPSYYVNLDKIPLTPNGKIDRTALPEPEPGVVSEQYVPPTNNIQKHLVNVWQEVLGVESIGINDNFFKIGGDSIKAIQVSTRLKKYGLDLKVNDLFLHPVIKEAEKCIKETGDEQKTPQSPGQEKKELTPRDMDLESRIPKEDLARINNYITSSIDENPEIQLIYPLSPMQNGMLYHWLRNEKSDSYFSQGVFTIEGEIEKSTLEDTFNQLIERYDILRTIFVYEDLEEPLQVVLNNRKARVYDEDITHLSENQGNLYLEEFKRKDKQRGFDLTRDILMRLSLFKTGFKDYCLVWSFHHILMDGWCLGIIFKDFIEIYHSLKQGKRVELPAVIPYINYIRWLEKQEKTAGLKYWQQYLEGYEEPVGLPKLGNLKRNDDYKLEEYDLIIDEKRVSALNSIARQEGVTVNTVFQTLWSVLLQRYNNTDEVVFGVVVSGRPPEIQGIEQMVGLFINTIPIRIKSRPDREFSQLLRMVQQKGALSRPYEYLPLAEIQSKSQLKVNLIDHIMVFENYPIQEEIKNAGIEPEYDFRAVNVRIHEQTNYNFNIVIFPGQYFLVKFSYNGLVYEGNLIKRVGLHLEEMIKQVIENPSKTIKEIGIITGVEKQQILYDFNQTAVKYPKEKTIHELFERQVEKTPDHTALTGQIPGKFGGSVSLTYKELNKKSNRLARILHEKGVESDTIVGVMVERSIEMIVGILAILKAGGAFLLIDPEYPRERIDYMLKDSNVSLLLTGLELLEDCKGTACCAPTASPAACNLPLSLAYIIYTSGTTGKPKGVMIQHQSLVNLCSWHNRYFQVKESDHATQYAKISFDASVWEIFPYLIKGASLTIIDTDIKLDIEKLNEFFETHDITIGFLPTQLCEQFMELENRSLRKLLTGGDRLGKFIKRDYQLYNNYGPTEDTVVNTSFPVNRYHINIPIGRPVDNNRIYILDKNGLFPQPIGIPGELCIAGDGLARGYLNNPELTAEKFFNYRSYSLYFSKKIYRTGDLARWLADGNIEFLGRIDLQVKIRGVRIELGEIENQLLNHKEIKEAVVIDKKTQDGDKYLCAYIVSDRELIPAELKKYLSGTMPDYMIPSYFVSIEKVPLTSSGKIDRKALPEPGVKPTGITIVPRNRVEKKLAEIWSEILISDVFATIGIDDNFFERGGHSLKATTLTAKIHKEFNVKIPLAQIFKTPVIRELAEIIKKAARNRFAAVEPVEKKDFYPLSSAQRRLYILQQMELNTTVYNIPQVVVLEGAINKRLKDTINRLIRRHEGLRTSFAVVDEEPVQKINPEVNFGLVEIEHCSVTDLPGIVTNFIRPFDLSQAPLLRVGLIETGEREHILMVDIHHIIADGVSHALLVKDFMALYGGEEGKLAKIPIQYKDYSQWQHSERQKEAVKKQETYWLKQFQGDIPVLDLPTDYPRPAIQSFEGNTLAFEIGSKEARALKELTHPAGVTLFMVLVSLFDILLLKLSGHENEDILVGTPISGRRHADLEPVIGMFVNTLVLRNSPHGHLTFEEFLNQVKETSIQAFENQDYLFEDLVDHPGLDIKRDPGRNPLFDVVFTFQNLDIPVLQVPGLKLKPYQDENIIKTAKFDITLTAQERGETLYFTFEYCTRLFKQETMARFAKYFQNIVSSVLENPGKKISGIEIILEEEKEQILFDFNNPSPLYPKEKTIHELFEKQVEKTTDNIALVGNVSITYNELNQRSDQLAHLLRAKGVKADTIVSIMVERSIEMIVGILAILKAGGAYLPISTDYPGERINYMLAESKTNLLLTTRTPAEPGEKVEKWKGEKIFLEDFKLPYSSHSSYLSHLSGNLAYIIYTSGTTGKPKGVMVRHFNVVRLVKNTNYIEFKEGDRILQTGALEFDASTFEIWGSLLNGLELSLVKNKIILSPGKLKDTIERNRITTIWLTAPLFNHLLDEEIEIFRGLRNLLVGGDVLSPSHINRLRNEFPRLNIINGYGPTENTTFSTTFLIDREYHESIPIGKPIANSTAYIVDKYGYLQPVGIAGELWVGGDGVVRGYLNNPELTIERFCLRRPGGRFLKKLPPWTPR